MGTEIAPRISSSTTLHSILLTQIYSRATLGIIATVVNASILAVVLKSVVPRRALTWWLLSMILFSLIRFAYTMNIKRNLFLLANVPTSKGLLIIGIGITGILWGSTAIFLFPTQSIGHQALIAFVLAGMVAGAVGVFSPILSVFLSFSIPTLTPICIRFILAGDEIHMAMAVMTLLFGVLTFITAKRVNIDTIELVLLKETFSDMLKERTEALRKTNKQLEREVERRKYTEKAILEERDKLQQMIAEIKTLRGFLPICSSCNKIRDDAGYWQKIEKYIQEHSEARFSHGICPECAQQLYPEINYDD